jgi:hypothetical protein
MKTIAAQQEVLLVITTTFSKRQLYRNNVKINGRSLSHTEQLEDACWNGLLNELLPEIMVKPSGKRLYLWYIHRGQFSLQMEMSEFPTDTDAYLSLNPKTFFSEMYLS